MHKQALKRLAVYYFYDADGIADDYVLYCLSELKKDINNLLVICYGKLSIPSRQKLQLIADYVIVSSDVNYNILAYKEAFKFFGSLKLAEYDEIILLDYTFFGPLYPFEEMFNKMDRLTLDFWGIATGHYIPYDPYGTIKYGYVPKHLQDNFIVLRKSLLQSVEFGKYWESIPEIYSDQQSKAYYGVVFTKEFEDKGFTWDSYINSDELEKHTHDPLIYSAKYLVEKKRCPIIKRLSFFNHTGEAISNSCGQEGLEVYEYIRDNLDYDVNMIWDNILRVQNQADIKNCMHLNYILSSVCCKENKSIKDKVALVMHIYYEDLIESCYEYAQSMPEYADIYVTTHCEAMKSQILTVFSKMRCNKLQVILVDNRGRDVSALLVGCKGFIKDYDIVCFAHDKKTKQVEPYSIGESFAYKCFENVLYNDNFVNNVVDTFLSNPRLGLLTPPPPNHSPFYITLGYGWSINYEISKKLADQLNVKVPIDCNKDPIAPLGTMFWFRTKALESLFKEDWEYEDFPKEPNANDGTLLHAFERLYPFIAQDHGYYPAWLMVDHYARVEHTNLVYMLSRLNSHLFKVYGLNSYAGLLAMLEASKEQDCQMPVAMNQDILLRQLLKNKLKAFLPRPLFVLLIKFKRMIFGPHGVKEI